MRRVRALLPPFIGFLSLALVAGFLGLAPASTHADTAQAQIDAANTQITALEAQITQYQNTLTQLGSQKSTLQNAIDSLNISIKKVAASVSVTQAKITQTTLALKQIGGAITDKQSRIESNKISIAKSMRSQNQSDEATLPEELLSAHPLSDSWEEAAALGALNDALKTDIENLLATKQSLTTDYNATKVQQSQLVTLKKQLAAQQAQLNQTKAQQSALLAQTKDSEATYQKLLSAAQAQLASFSAFAANAGGSGLLGNQTVCDSWGCYYNQRDSAWGNMSLNGTKYRLASDGCLVTSVAMVLTHYGYKNVTPVSINSNPENFAAYYPAYLLATVHVGSLSATRITAKIDATLAGGDPVIVGLYAYGGTHFVVLVSGRAGSYLMRDPYVANGRDISFTAHYAVRNIYEVNKVVIN